MADISTLTPENPQGIGIGDIVRLRCGGFIMCVENVVPHLSGKLYAACMWHDEYGDPQSWEYDVKILVRQTPARP